MNLDILEFVSIVIGAIAEKLGLQVSDVFRRLKISSILDLYIIPSYDVLYTFSLPYVIDVVVDVDLIIGWILLGVADTE